jgi:protein involved in polysaccharide export with SLBB domain
MKTRLFAIGYLLLGVAVPLLAQEPASALASRAFLRSELTRLGNDPSAALIRARLDSGDFQAGDRIFIRVRGDSVLTDTFTVLSDLQLPLPVLGAVPLRGVLRSELKDTINAYLSRYLRAPIVEVRPLMRIVVEGQVLKPGFVAAAPEQPLADVISAAGGFTQQAKVTDIRLQRGGRTLLSGRKLTDAMGQGYSLDRLSVRAGDRVFVPGHTDSAKTLQMVSVLLALPLTILALRRAF